MGTASAFRVTAQDSVREYYRYPVGIVDIGVAPGPRRTGYFQFGSGMYFGAYALEDTRDRVTDRAGTPDVSSHIIVNGSAILLPFDPAEVSDNLRLERYVFRSRRTPRIFLDSIAIRRAYYFGRRFMPVRFRKHLQRIHLGDWKRIPFPRWPVDCSVDLMYEQLLRLAVEGRSGTPIPFIWFWPEGYSTCMIMTHDVEETRGRDFCFKLMELDEGAGLHSAFNLIPEQRYVIPTELRREISSRGHELNIHDLNHDGRLFEEHAEFLRRLEVIHRYAAQFGAGGFRSGVLYRNLEWYESFQFEYDMSVPNVAHLDPQRGGCCTIMPYFIKDILELPLTTTQDYSLFHILEDYSLTLWEQQIDIIAGRHGLLSFNIHPDYITEERELAVYMNLLSALRSLQQSHRVWAALPGEVNSWWRMRAQMELIPDGTSWRITGKGSERARLAHAAVADGRLVYTLE
jgi:hypothetical protein